MQMLVETIFSINIKYSLFPIIQVLNLKQKTFSTLFYVFINEFNDLCEYMSAIIIKVFNTFSYVNAF